MTMTAPIDMPTARARGFALIRTLDASPEQVFRAWTDPAHLTWYFNDTMPFPDEPIEVDLRPGGQWRQMMAIDAETRYMTGGLYIEIVPPERLVFVWGAIGGWPKLDPDNLDDCPLVTLSLTADGNQTVMHLDVRMPEGMSDERATQWMATPHMQQGWSDTIDRIAGELARD
jgi:uncharacterized protein YndB with AHSA1/START domain